MTGGVDALVLEAAALAEKGALDRTTAECGRCGVPQFAHDDQEAGHGHELSAAWLLAEQALGAADRQVMDDVVEHLNAQYRPSGKSGPSPSDAGACRRQLWYRDHGHTLPDYTPNTEIDERRAALGSLVHRAAQEAGEARYPWRRYEMPIQIPGLERGGRIDCYDPVLGEVTDDQTAGRAKWQMFGDDGPTEAKWEQAAIYGYALAMQDMPVRTLRIIAINRDTGVEEHFHREFDPAFGLAALDKLLEVATVLEAGVMPPRDGFGPKHWMCEWCPALAHCWNVDAATKAGRSPESYTLLGPEPEDPSIVWAGRQALEAAAERLKWEKREKRAKALLQGLKARRYGADREDGGIEITDSWNTSYGYKEAYETLRALYALPEAQRPPVAELPDVPVSRSVTQKPKKPGRAATRAGGRPRKQTAAEKAATATAAAVVTPTGP